jgi:hypothetical protein
MQGWIEREKQGYYKGQEEDKILYYAGGAGELNMLICCLIC